MRKVSKDIASLLQAALTSDLNQELVSVPYISCSCHLAEVSLNTFVLAPWTLSFLFLELLLFFNLYNTAGDDR